MTLNFLYMIDPETGEIRDDFDFFPKHQSKEIQKVIERYIGKYKPHYIKMISTPSGNNTLLKLHSKNDPFKAFKQEYTFKKLDENK